MDNIKILVADDDEDIRDVIDILLTSEGYHIFCAKNGIEALELLDQHDFGVIILDIMMPQMNGYQTCLKIREKSMAPILFLSAKSKESDKTLGFSSGGDDYLVKPFSYNELTSRVKALLRRYYVYKNASQDIHSSTLLKHDELIVNQSNHEVTINDEAIELTDIEFQILMLLMRNPGQTFSAQYLYEQVWKEPYYYSANNTVMVHIRNLRKKIERDAQNPKIIKTIWGKGYRFDKA